MAMRGQQALNPLLVLQKGLAEAFKSRQHILATVPKRTASSVLEPVPKPKSVGILLLFSKLILTLHDHHPRTLAAESFAGVEATGFASGAITLKLRFFERRDLSALKGGRRSSIRRIVID